MSVRRLRSELMASKLMPSPRRGAKKPTKDASEGRLFAPELTAMRNTGTADGSLVEGTNERSA